MTSHGIFVSLLTFLLSIAIIHGAIETPKYLVFPPPTSGTPTKVQLILGLGLPMEVAYANTIIGYVLKSNYNLPYNVTDLYVGSYGSYYDREQRSTSSSSRFGLGRYEIYKMITESMMDGKICLLRAICEAAATPFGSEDSIFAQLLHIFLTPSSTDEDYDESTDQEYLAAESIGLRGGRVDECTYAFRDCDTSVLSYFSKIN